LEYSHNPKVVGSNPTPATKNSKELADVQAANPFALPRNYPGIGFAGRIRTMLVQLAGIIDYPASPLALGGVFA